MQCSGLNVITKLGATRVNGTPKTKTIWVINAGIA